LFGVELAAMRGLRVIAAAGDDDEKLVRELGASDFVPRSADLAPAVRDLVPGGVDAAFDAAVLGYPALDAVRAGGSFAAFVGSGLTLRVAGTYPLADAARAHERLEAAGVRGRLVLVP
jgi:NADPH:quinone reductase